MRGRSIRIAVAMLALVATLACTLKPRTRGTAMLTDDERAAGTYPQETTRTPVPLPEEPLSAWEAMAADTDRRVPPPPQERPVPLPEEPRPPR